MGSAPDKAELQRSFGLLKRHVVSLFLRDGRGELDSLATGLLVAAPHAVFLISAAHVFDELSHKDICFYAGKQTLRNVRGKTLVTSIAPGKTRDDDRIDVGVCRMEGEGLPPYPDLNKIVLPMASLRPCAYPREHKQYLFTGFPNSKSKFNAYYRHMQTDACGTLCKSAAPEEYAKLGCNPQTHIVMPFDHRKVDDLNGKVREFPEPRGISGSPLWLLVDETEQDGSTLNAVAGIVTEYHKDKRLLVAADIAAVLGLMNGLN